MHNTKNKTQARVILFFKHENLKCALLSLTYFFGLPQRKHCSFDPINFPQVSALFSYCKLLSHNACIGQNSSHRLSCRMRRMASSTNLEQSHTPATPNSTQSCRSQILTSSILCLRRSTPLRCSTLGKDSSSRTIRGSSTRRSRSCRCSSKHRSRNPSRCRCSTAPTAAVRSGRATPPEGTRAAAQRCTRRTR
jgi:hypothetical protein